jgi:hypothetical protein
MLKLYAIALSLIAGNAFASGSELIVNPTNLTTHAKSAAAMQRTNVLASQKNFKNATLVDINLDAFQSNIVNIDFKGYHFQYIKTGGEATDAQNWSWTGNADHGIGDAVVTSYQGTLIGSFHYQGQLLNLEQTGPNEYMLEELGERNGKPTGQDGANIADGQERALQIDKASKKN